MQSGRRSPCPWHPRAARLQNIGAIHRADLNRRRESSGARQYRRRIDASGFRDSGLLGPAYDLELLSPQGDFRTGDTVIDGKNYLFQITALDTDAMTYSVTRRLARLGVTDYRELDNLPHLGKLAGLDSVGEEQLNDIINLGSIQ